MNASGVVAPSVARTAAVAVFNYCSNRTPRLERYRMSGSPAARCSSGCAKGRLSTRGPAGRGLSAGEPDAPPKSEGRFGGCRLRLQSVCCVVMGDDADQAALGIDGRQRQDAVPRAIIRAALSRSASTSRGTGKLDLEGPREVREHRGSAWHKDSAARCCRTPRRVAFPQTGQLGRPHVRDAPT